jgi:predicted  nucleic acid-binding Zn-ribbon protein
MSDPSFWSIVAVALSLIVTVIGSLVAILSYGHHRRQALSYWERLKGLPDKVEREFLVRENEKLRAEYETLKDNVFDAQQTIDAAAHQRQWMENAKEEIARLEQDKVEVLRIQNELETAQSQLAALNEQKAQLDGEVAQRKSKLEELDDKANEMRKQLINLDFEVEKANRLREEIKRLEQQKADATEESEQLTRAASDLKSRLESELSALTVKRDELRRELDTLNKGIESRGQEYLELESSVKRLQESLEALGSEERSLKRQLDDMKIQAQKADSLAKELTELENKRKTAREEADSLDQRLKELKRQKDESLAEAEKLKAAVGKIAKEQTELEQERRRLKSEVEKLESRSNALSAQIPVMESAFNHLSSGVNQNDRPLPPEENEIWQPVISVVAATEREARNELDCLTDLHSRLLSLGLKFDPRILNAFHTSLKTTDSSPLVTLAGVSGTGKSELPRRYAEATGMNFLNVAVQPRWDSPQDLFGFYDYLERRFRPTDLTRALIQMDSFGPAEGRGWNPPAEYEKQRLPNQILLVLLDEMNLARIEYYFSEFLSRLETRRGIDPKNSQRRKLAEISLDVGGRRSGQPPMQLFVDKNVLFVGTMNEDETTQALSDKVIDRANVLRFGSPNSITPVDSKVRNGQTTKDRPMLTRKTWEGWCKNSDSINKDERTKLLDWIGQLRSAMDQVNRPFAYRVAHSMLEYAANYPDIDGRIEYVISDQIEQKMLPKLMGLNPQDTKVQRAFGTINSILDQVGDSVLRSKIDHCCKDDYFQWAGVDRSEV